MNFVWLWYPGSEGCVNTVVAYWILLDTESYFSIPFEQKLWYCSFWTEDTNAIMKAYVVMEVEQAGYESLHRGFGASAKPKYKNGSTETEVRKWEEKPPSILWISRLDTAHEQWTTFVSAQMHTEYNDLSQALDSSPLRSAYMCAYKLCMRDILQLRHLGKWPLYQKSINGQSFVLRWCKCYTSTYIICAHSCKSGDVISLNIQIFAEHLNRILSHF